MKYYSERMNKLITQLSMLPGIGQKTAERLAYHIVKLPKERVATLADSIRDASENVSYCKTCFATSDEEMCPVCRSQNRNRRNTADLTLIYFWTSTAGTLRHTTKQTARRT